MMLDVCNTREAEGYSYWLHMHCQRGFRAVISSLEPMWSLRVRILSQRMKGDRASAELDDKIGSRFDSQSRDSFADKGAPGLWPSVNHAGH